jgi:hypothetical protein
MSADLNVRIARSQAFRDTVRREHPMGAARIVRRERFAWPGGYPLVLVLTDGGTLCPDCVAREWSLISCAHRHHERNGWAPIGLDIVEATETDVRCDHCGKLIAEAVA